MILTNFMLRTFNSGHIGSLVWR